MEYLYAQCGFSYSTELERRELEEHEGDSDEGFEEEEELHAEPLIAGTEEEPVTPLPPAGDSEKEEDVSLWHSFQALHSSTIHVNFN